MYGLWQIILRYSALWLFLGLEALCFYIIVKYNTYQKDIYDYSSTLWIQKANQKVQNWENYFRLQKINDSLIQEYEVLLEERLQLIAGPEERGDSVVIRDSIPRYALERADVVFASVHRRKNYIVVDKGIAAGIDPGMGVMGQEGVTGIVDKVSKNFSRIIPLIHVNAHLSVRLGEDGFYGTTNWYGKDPGYVVIEDIPKHARVKQGDEVITSGFSHTFVAGLPVGVVKEVDLEEGSNFYEIKVRLYSDFYQIHTVFIIRDLLEEEKAGLIPEDL